MNIFFCFAEINNMKKSTKILLVVYVVITIGAVIFGRYIFSSLSVVNEKINFDFNAYSISALVLNAISFVLGNILFFRFIKSLPLDRAIFFSSAPLVVTYGVSMFFLSGLVTYKNDMAITLSSALNISQENNYNTILWAVLITIVFIAILFMNYFLLSRPVGRVERVVARLGDGKIKQEKIKIGGISQFHNIEHSLNKINGNYLSKEHSSRKVEGQNLSKNMWRFFDKNDISQIEKGQKIRKNASILFLKLYGKNNSNDMKENFHLANSYLNSVCPIIQRYGGFIDNFFGDGLLAVFSSSVKTLECVKTLAKTMCNFNRKNKANIKIKLKTILTSCMVDFSFISGKPTIVSDELSFLLKIEHATKTMHVGAIFTKSLLDQLPLEYKFAYRYIGTINIEENKHFLFQNLEVLPRDRQRMLLKTKNTFEKGVEFYKSGVWERAKIYFENVLRCDSSDGCAYIYFNNCKEKID